MTTGVGFLRRLIFWRPFKFAVWVQWRLLPGGMTRAEHRVWRETFDRMVVDEQIRQRQGRRRAQRKGSP